MVDLTQADVLYAYLDGFYLTFCLPRRTIIINHYVLEMKILTCLL